MMETRSLQLEQLRLKEQEALLRECLPHLYGFKFYPWARIFFESTNYVNLICAANQISKSSSAIRKNIHWATAPDLWPRLWKTRPYMFWYLYPTRDVATIEFEKKWETEFLPRKEFKDHPVFGWKAQYKADQIIACHFNTGVSIYFKTYAQDVQDLQTGTVHMLTGDEEMPETLVDELLVRLAATDGYFNAVFTPTLGQEYWRQAVEEKGQWERFKGAMKQQISMYDCLKYEDGTDSHWSKEKIQRVINGCKSDKEVQRRVFGRFIVDDGLKYPSFSRQRNIRKVPEKVRKVPKGWSVYVGADPGSGGQDGHPSAVCLVAVDPKFQRGRIIGGWRGDDVITTAGDVVKKCVEMTNWGTNNPMPVAAVKYDWACKDFYTIGTGMENPLPIEKAEKSHAIGENVINVLFKNQMIWGYDIPELESLWNELASLKTATLKRSAKDDYADAFRYAVSAVPWDFSVISDKPILDAAAPEKTAAELEIEARRNAVIGDPDERLSPIEKELEEWNRLMNDDYIDGGDF